MANRFFGEAPLALEDGRKLTLRLDMLAMFNAEESAGLSWDLLMKRLENKSAPKMRIIAALVSAMLEHHHPGEFDLAGAGELMHSDSVAVMTAMDLAMMAAFGGKAAADPRGGADAKPKAPSRGTGTRSPKRGRARG